MDTEHPSIREAQEYDLYGQLVGRAKRLRDQADRFPVASGLFIEELKMHKALQDIGRITNDQRLALHGILYGGKP